MTRAILASTLGLLSLSSTWATTIVYNGNDVTRGEDIIFQTNSGGGLTQDFTFAGVFNVTVDGNPLAYAFCLDTFVTAGSMTANESGAASVNGGTRIAWLFDNAFPLINSTAGYAGLQLAIWDIYHDSGDGFDAGVIQRDTLLTSSAVLAAANGFLTSSAGQSSPNAVVYTNVLGAGASQTMITGVPEPATIGIAGAALAGLGLLRRRVKKS